MTTINYLIINHNNKIVSTKVKKKKMQQYDAHVHVN